MPSSESVVRCKCVQYLQSRSIGTVSNRIADPGFRCLLSHRKRKLQGKEPARNASARSDTRSRQKWDRPTRARISPRNTSPPKALTIRKAKSLIRRGVIQTCAHVIATEVAPRLCLRANAAAPCRNCDNIVVPASAIGADSYLALCCWFAWERGSA